MTHDYTGQRVQSDDGFATWQGHLDPLTGDRVLIAWARPRPPAPPVLIKEPSMSYKIFFRDHEDSATGRPIPVNLELVILTDDIDCEWCGTKITNMLAAKITDDDGFVDEYAHVSHLDSPDIKIDRVEDLG